MTANRHPLIDALHAVVGTSHVMTGADISERHLHDTMRALEHGAPLAVVRPADTAQVSHVLRLCHEAHVPVVPQGGLTGLTGAAVPVAGGVALSLERMDGVLEVDSAAATLTAWAGTPLQTLQEAAAAAELFMPLDLGARGSCRIGGNLSTNAGGNRVLRYGMARDMVLGLEAVLADGTVLSSMNKMIKNNTGYDLKQLFIGSEGTLGVITQVVLRLYPLPRSTCTAVCAVDSYEQVLALLHHTKSGLGATLSAFEMMWSDFYERVTLGVPGLSTPLPHGHRAYVLVEMLGTEQDSDQARFETVLGQALQRGIIADAAIAQSRADTQAFWKVRDASGEFPRVLWPNVGFDVSIPTAGIGKFIEACTQALQQRWPDVHTVFFGHVGDANIHIGVHLPGGQPQPEHEIDTLVYDLVRRWHGSISAEHGIGLTKLDYLVHSRSAAEIAVMRTLKRALDPHGILNPGKVFTAA